MHRMLSVVDREEISRGVAEGLEYREIAERVGRDPSVVSREVRRFGGREGRSARDVGEWRRGARAGSRASRARG